MTPPPPPPSGGDGVASYTNPLDAASSHRRVYPYTVVDERRKNDAAELLEAEGVCPPNLAQGSSEELSFRFGWNAVFKCRQDRDTVGVVASPVYSPNGLVYVGSSDSYFYALDTLTGRVVWKLYADSPIGSSAAVDSNGQLYFASNAGTIYQMDAPYVPPVDIFVDPFLGNDVNAGFG